MKSKVLEKIWIILAALGIGVSLFINNSNKLIESNASNFSNAIISNLNFPLAKVGLYLENSIV